MAAIAMVTVCSRGPAPGFSHPGELGLGPAGRTGRTAWQGPDWAATGGASRASCPLTSCWKPSTPAGRAGGSWGSGPPAPSAFFVPRSLLVTPVRGPCLSSLWSVPRLRAGDCSTPFWSEWVLPPSTGYGGRRALSPGTRALLDLGPCFSASLHSRVLSPANGLGMHFDAGHGSLILVAFTLVCDGLGTPPQASPGPCSPRALADVHFCPSGWSAPGFFCQGARHSPGRGLVDVGRSRHLQTHRAARALRGAGQGTAQRCVAREALPTLALLSDPWSLSRVGKPAGARGRCRGPGARQLWCEACQSLQRAPHPPRALEDSGASSRTAWAGGPGVRLATRAGPLLLLAACLGDSCSGLAKGPHVPVCLRASPARGSWMGMGVSGGQTRARARRETVWAPASLAEMGLSWRPGAGGGGRPGALRGGS